MKKIILVTSLVATLSLVFAVYGTPGQQTQTAAPTAEGEAQARQRAAVNDSAAEKAIISQYCMTCHSDKARAAGVDSARKIDFDQLDVAHVEKDAKTWELIVRKL